MTDTPTETAENPLALLGQMDLQSIDPDKVEKLLSLQERWEDRQAITAHAAAVVAFQAEMPQIKKGRSVQGKYQYASYDDIMKVARPILQKHGLAVGFSQTEENDTITVVCRITHTAGHSTETPLTIPKLGAIKSREGRDVTNLAQAMGSTLTYAKRYCLCNAMDIVVTDEDDDGAAAGAGPKITAEQANEIDSLLGELEALEKGGAARFVEWAGVKDVAEIPAAEYGERLGMLRKKIDKLAK